MENWKAIPGWEGRYEASDLGRVRNATSCAALNPWLCSGYPTVGLKNGKVRKIRTVHGIVLETFGGPRPPGCHAAHLDGVRENARFDNLAWVTPSENEAHKIKHGTFSRGRAALRRQFTDRQVEIVREIATMGVSQTKIALLLGVPDSTVARIIHRKTYA